MSNNHEYSGLLKLLEPAIDMISREIGEKFCCIELKRVLTAEKDRFIFSVELFDKINQFNASGEGENCIFSLIPTGMMFGRSESRIYIVHGETYHTWYFENRQALYDICKNLAHLSFRA